MFNIEIKLNNIFSFIELPTFSTNTFVSFIITMHRKLKSELKTIAKHEHKQKSFGI